MWVARVFTVTCLGVRSSVVATGAAVPDVAVPDRAVPKVAFPDVAVPDAAMPGVAALDEILPDEVLLDGGVLDVTVPDAAATDAVRLPVPRSRSRARRTFLGGRDGPSLPDSRGAGMAPAGTGAAAG